MRRLSALMVVLAAGGLLEATSVIEPTFVQLVEHADTVFEGVVVDVQPTLRSDASGRSIVTAVTFDIHRVLKGSPPPRLVLEFLGGTVGDLTFTVADMPQFAVGDEDLLFARTRGRFASPIVGFMHGRFRIFRFSPGGPAVRRFNGAAFTSVTGFGGATTPPSPAVPLSLSEFENAIVAEVARQQVGAR